MKPPEAFSLLGSTHRYHAIRNLMEGDGVASVDALSEYLAAKFEDADVDRAKVALVHTHIPKLEEADVIEHRNGVVTLTETGATLGPFLRAARELEDVPSEMIASY